MDKDKIKVSSPWVTYMHQIDELFCWDPEIRVEQVNDNKIRLLVNNTDKADALTQLLPAEKYFNGVKIMIEVVPANRKTTTADLIETALKGNPKFERMEHITRGASNTFHYPDFPGNYSNYQHSIF